MLQIQYFHILLLKLQSLPSSPQLIFPHQALLYPSVRSVSRSRCRFSRSFHRYRVSDSLTPRIAALFSYSTAVDYVSCNPFFFFLSNPASTSILLKLHLQNHMTVTVGCFCCCASLNASVEHFANVLRFECRIASFIASKDFINNASCSFIVDITFSF